MYALVDCDNFYVSCHRLFEPRHLRRPVIVLSNNDGCVIARSNEAKACGIPMGIHLYKIIDEIKRKDIVVFSSHYTLYGDISSRVMANLARFTSKIEPYSIDECFIKVDDPNHLSLYAQNLKSIVGRNTGIPISIGIGPTKVLAKVASRLSKKAKGIAILDTEMEISKVLSDYPIEEVWGIGREFSTKLMQLGVMTAGQFRTMPMDWVQKNMTIKGVRIWRELWGQPCIPLKNLKEPRKVLTTSRSFGILVSDYEQLKEIAISYTARLAAKLRREQLCSAKITLRLFSRTLKSTGAQQNLSTDYILDHPVNNTFELVHAAESALKMLYSPGQRFYKMEVTAHDLSPKSEVQLNIFNQFNGDRYNQLSSVMDKINNLFGAGTLKLSGEGLAQKWAMKRDFLQPSYTTKWNDILKVN